MENKTVMYVHKSKTRDGYAARTIFWKRDDVITIERRALVPISELSPLYPCVELRRFKDRALISTFFSFRAETMREIMRFTESKGWLDKS
ncbi:MAG: hypothetical protein LBL13_11405 [Bacteroidales bacterium]|jgi:hypothetical protein|nr:hypothetical protein [Bacteroidales bacterium]